MEHTAIVSQEPFLFDASILENIHYGRPEASLEDVTAPNENHLPGEPVCWAAQPVGQPEGSSPISPWVGSLSEAAQSLGQLWEPWAWEG